MTDMEAGASYLDGVEFPATKQDLIDAADDAGVPQEVIERLQALDSEHYENVSEVQQELSEED